MTGFWNLMLPLVAGIVGGAVAVAGSSLYSHFRAYLKSRPNWRSSVSAVIVESRAWLKDMG
jgi:hypothetical protein